MLLRLGVFGCAVAAIASAEGFTFTIGSAAAAQEPAAKMAAFAVRVENCSEPQISGTAEGLVNGMRRSLALKVSKMSKPGVYAVFPNWSADGEWVVNLKGTCGTETAGAIVPLGPRGFIRESSKILARPATAAEINDSLKALAGGGNK